MNWGLMEILPPSSFFSNSPNFLIEENNDDDDARSGSSARWTAAQNKMFENALAFFDEDTPDRWQCVAAMVPGKTVVDVIRQYKELEDDVSIIEAGLTPIPCYGYGGTLPMFSLDWRRRKCPGSGRPGSEHDRKKGVPWTEEEHKLFLMGLNKYGKGDWRNISRNFVVTRTPTQVASHAQKYFIRQLSGAKDKRRASIHDITTMSINDDKVPSQDHKNPTSIDQSYDILAKSTGTQKLPFQLNNETTMRFHSSSDDNICGLPGYGVNLYGLNELTSRVSQHVAFQVGSGVHYLNV